MTPALIDVVTTIRLQQQWFKPTTTASFRPFRPNASHQISTETTSEANTVGQLTCINSHKGLKKTQERVRQDIKSVRQRKSINNDRRTAQGRVIEEEGDERK